MKKVFLVLISLVFLFGYSIIFAQNFELAEFKQLGDEQVTVINKAEAAKKLEQIEKRDKTILDNFMAKEDKKYISHETPDPLNAIKVYNQFKGAMVRISDVYNPKTNISIKIYQIIIPQ